MEPFYHVLEWWKMLVMQADKPDLVWFGEILVRAMEIYNSFLGCVMFFGSSEMICWLIGYIYVNLFFKNQHTHMVCISGICNFEKLYPIHTLGYMHGISYLRGDVCHKSGVSRLWKLYIYIYIYIIGLWVFSILSISCWDELVPILSICWCFHFCQFVGMWG